jgi:hypothetical protein
MKNYISAIFLLVSLYSCSEPVKTESDHKIDTLAVRKRTFAEEIPPPSDLKQFKWFYSAFVKLVALHDDTLLNKVINPEFGINIIESNGALPKITNVKDFSKFRTIRRKPFYEFNTDVLICDPKEEELPKVNCDAKDLYTKTGCFTREINTLKDSKIWEFCSLPKAQADLVASSAQTITRTVLLTDNYTYYFSLINGSWWLTFIDMRRPCEA